MNNQCNQSYLRFRDLSKIHDDVIRWKHFPRYWPFVRGLHRSPVNSPYKDQWRGALMFSLICACTNDWVNNRDAGNLRRHRAHLNVTVMSLQNLLSFRSARVSKLFPRRLQYPCARKSILFKVSRRFKIGWNRFKPYFLKQLFFCLMFNGGSIVVYMLFKQYIFSRNEST